MSNYDAWKSVDTAMERAAKRWDFIIDLTKKELIAELECRGVDWHQDDEGNNIYSTEAEMQDELFDLMEERFE